MGPPPSRRSRSGFRLKTGIDPEGLHRSWPVSYPRSGPAKGGVAQLGERLLCKQEVVGSIPFTSTKVDGGCFVWG